MSCYIPSSTLFNKAFNARNVFGPIKVSPREAEFGHHFKLAVFSNNSLRVRSRLNGEYRPVPTIPENHLPSDRRGILEYYNANRDKLSVASRAARFCRDYRYTFDFETLDWILAIPLFIRESSTFDDFRRPDSLNPHPIGSHDWEMFELNHAIRMDRVGGPLAPDAEGATRVPIIPPMSLSEYLDWCINYERPINPAYLRIPGFVDRLPGLPSSILDNVGESGICDPPSSFADEHDAESLPVSQDCDDDELTHECDEPEDRALTAALYSGYDQFNFSDTDNDPAFNAANDAIFEALCLSNSSPRALHVVDPCLPPAPVQPEAESTATHATTDALDWASEPTMQPLSMSGDEEPACGTLADTLDHPNLAPTDGASTRPICGDDIAVLSDSSTTALPPLLSNVHQWTIEGRDLKLDLLLGAVSGDGSAKLCDFSGLRQQCIQYSQATGCTILLSILHAGRVTSSHEFGTGAPASLKLQYTDGTVRVPSDFIDTRLEGDITSTTRHFYEMWTVADSTVTLQPIDISAINMVSLVTTKDEYATLSSKATASWFLQDYGTAVRGFFTNAGHLPSTNVDSNGSYTVKCLRTGVQARVSNFSNFAEIRNEAGVCGVAARAIPGFLSINDMQPGSRFTALGVTCSNNLGVWDMHVASPTTVPAPDAPPLFIGHVLEERSLSLHDPGDGTHAPPSLKRFLFTLGSAPRIPDHLRPTFTFDALGSFIPLNDTARSLPATIVPDLERIAPSLIATSLSLARGTSPLPRLAFSEIDFLGNIFLYQYLGLLTYLQPLGRFQDNRPVSNEVSSKPCGPTGYLRVSQDFVQYPCGETGYFTDQHTHHSCLRAYLSLPLITHASEYSSHPSPAVLPGKLRKQCRCGRVPFYPTVNVPCVCSLL